MYSKAPLTLFFNKFFMFIYLFRWSKIFRNKLEDKQILEQINQHVGPGLAAAYFYG